MDGDIDEFLANEEPTRTQTRTAQVNAITHKHHQYARTHKHKRGTSALRPHVTQGRPDGQGPVNSQKKEAPRTRPLSTSRVPLLQPALHILQPRVFDDARAREPSMRRLKHRRRRQEGRLSCPQVSHPGSNATRDITQKYPAKPGQHSRGQCLLTRVSQRCSRHPCADTPTRPEYAWAPRRPTCAAAHTH